MPFGRYRGWPLDELPDDYLGWLFGLDDLREPLRSAVEGEWQARFGFAAALVPLPREAVPVADELVTAGYRALTRQHHPDAGGDHRTMTLVNAAAEWLRRQVRSAA
jgi:Putative quorum-sensing-regulated virulence factor